MCHFQDEQRPNLPILQDLRDHPPSLAKSDEQLGIVEERENSIDDNNESIETGVESGHDLIDWGLDSSGGQDGTDNIDWGYAGGESTGEVVDISSGIDGVLIQ